MLIGGLFIAAPHMTSAKNGGGSEFKTNLDACCAAASEDNDGKAEYRKQTNNGVTKQERFRTQVRVELPSAVLGIADAASAQAADVRVILTRSGTDYAECTLEFDEVEQEMEIEDGGSELKTEAEFAVDIRNQLKKNNLVVRANKGACDIDLTAPGTQAGVPVVQAGDTATVTLVDPTETTLAPASRALDKDFLQGTF